MPGTQASELRTGDRLLLVGTMKGAFLFRGRGKAFTRLGERPHFPGQPVYAVAYDDRAGAPRLYAGTENPFFGSVLRRSDDLGRTWTEPAEPNVKFPEEAGLALKRIWQIAPGRASEPDVLYCGVEPSSLFESRDGGTTWSLVRGLHDHPHREKWTPGGGGQCLHTVLPHPKDPARMIVAMSTGGAYRTEDGGKTWQASNQGVRAQFLPDKYPEFGQCVHKIVRHPSRPDRYFLQNHWGLYRSDDGGRSWTDIANGVPSDFGFGMAIHPRDPDTVYIVPLTSDEFRCTPEAKLRVYRTRDAGASWQALTRGLPQRDAFETVLRDALATDAVAGGETTGPAARKGRSSPTGVFFGTRSGKLFASTDDGNSWQCLADGLPPVVCVRAAVVGGSPDAGRPAAPPRSRAALSTRSRSARPASPRGGPASRRAKRRR